MTLQLLYVTYSVFCLLAIRSATTELTATADSIDFPTRHVSACLDSEHDTRLEIVCRGGRLMKLVTVLYGHGDVGRCQYEPNDCVTHLPSADNISCVGAAGLCPIILPSTEFGRLIPGCKKRATYVQASYQCIPETIITDICERSVQPGLQYGFISTPRYPHSYPDNTDCHIKVDAPYGDQRVRLFIVELSLETNGTGCADWLQLFDGYKSSTLCGSRARSWLGTSTHHFYQIHFYSNERNSMKGFWLYYDVVPYVNDTPTTPLTSVFTQTTQHAVVDVELSDVNDRDVVDWSTRSSSLATNQVLLLSATQLPFPLVAGSLVGVVIALFACIVVVVIIVTVLVVRRNRRSRRLNQSPTVTDSSNVHRVYTVSLTPKSNAEKSRQTRQHQQLLHQPVGFVARSGASSSSCTGCCRTSDDCSNLVLDYRHSLGVDTDGQCTVWTLGDGSSYEMPSSSNSRGHAGSYATGLPNCQPDRGHPNSGRYYEKSASPLDFPSSQLDDPS